MLDERGGGGLDRQQDRTSRSDADALEGDRRRSRRVPALTTRFATVNGRRFSTFRVVLPTVRRAGLTVTNAEATARSIDLDSVAPSSTETDEVLRKTTLPKGSQALFSAHELTTIRPWVSPALDSVRMTLRNSAGAEAAGSSSDSTT